MPRPRPKRTLFEAAQKKAEDILLVEGAKELIRIKKENDGNLPYGSVPRLLSEMGCPNITRHKLRHKVVELEKTESIPSIASTTGTATAADDVSEITDPSGVLSPSAGNNTSNSTTTDSSASNAVRNKGGRPKKSGAELMPDQLKALKKSAMTKVCVEYEKALQKHKRKPPPGTLKHIMSKVAKDHKLPDNVEICSRDAVYKRLKRGNTTGISASHESPMVHVEEIL